MSRTWRRDDSGRKNHGDSRREKRREKRHFDDPLAERQEHHKNKRYNTNTNYRDFELDTDD